MKTPETVGLRGFFLQAAYPDQNRGQHLRTKQKDRQKPVFYFGAVSDDKSEPNASSISAKVIVFVPSL